MRRAACEVRGHASKRALLDGVAVVARQPGLSMGGQESPSPFRRSANGPDHPPACLPDARAAGGRKRGQNWTTQQTLRLVEMKCAEWEAEVAAGRSSRGGQAHLPTAHAKWEAIQLNLEALGIHKDVDELENRWTVVRRAYNKIQAFNRRKASMPSSGQRRWEDLSSRDRKAEGLPQQFDQQLMHALRPWLERRATYSGPHVLDLPEPARLADCPAAEVEGAKDELGDSPAQEDASPSVEATPAAQMPGKRCRDDNGKSAKRWAHMNAESKDTPAAILAMLDRRDAMIEARYKDFQKAHIDMLHEMREARKNVNENSARLTDVLAQQTELCARLTGVLAQQSELLSMFVHAYKGREA
eukprot:SM000131S26711  [mRNA]  locus=s131:146704:148038:- [translate_table: standard]